MEFNKLYKGTLHEQIETFQKLNYNYEKRKKMIERI